MSQELLESTDAVAERGGTNEGEGSESSSDAGSAEKWDVEVVVGMSGGSSMSSARPAHDRRDGEHNQRAACGSPATPATKKKKTTSAVWEDFEIDRTDKNYVKCLHFPAGKAGRLKCDGGSTCAMNNHLLGVHNAMTVARGRVKDSRQGSLEDIVVVAPNFKRDYLFWQLMTYQVLYTLPGIL